MAALCPYCSQNSSKRSLAKQHETSVISSRRISAIRLSIDSGSSSEYLFTGTATPSPNTNEISLFEALGNYSIYDSLEKRIEITEENVEFYLPRILSIIPFGRTGCEIKPNVSSPIRIISARKRIGSKFTCFRNRIIRTYRLQSRYRLSRQQRQTKYRFS